MLKTLSGSAEVTHVDLNAEGKALPNGTKLYAALPSLSVSQLVTAFGKYAAGYRPGDELWSAEDQQALDAVMSGETPT
jgi:hypothetical protein